LLDHQHTALSSSILSVSTTTTSSSDLLVEAERVKAQLQHQVSTLTSALTSLKTKAQSKLSEFKAALERERALLVERSEHHRSDMMVQTQKVEDLRNELQSLRSVHAREEAVRADVATREMHELRQQIRKLTTECECLESSRKAAESEREVAAARVSELLSAMESLKKTTSFSSDSAPVTVGQMSEWQAKETQVCLVLL
jgi:chromosome segregation ATPase